MTEQESEILKAIAEGRVVKTKSGLDVRIYATDGAGDYPIHGAVRFDKSAPWSVRTWTREGRHAKDGTSDLDLVIKPRTIELDAWLNVYEDGSTFRYATKKAADIEASSSRFACINIKRTVTEGQGL